MTMSTAGFVVPVRSVDVHQVASVIKNRVDTVLILDSRSFIEHNSCHISSSVNVCCSKIVKRRLQQDKLSVKELLIHTCHCDVDEKLDVVVYDQSSKDVDSLQADSFVTILLKKLQIVFQSVNLLTGGFDEFHKCYPDLCEDKTRKGAPLTSLSQPCLPIANQGPTRILPFLYLGSQFDAINKELLKDYNITYELNVSTSCPRPEFVPEGHFMRIPVNDTYSEKLLPYFPEAFHFLDKVREGNGCVLVHCLAGISRSPTVAIAYVMRYLRLSSDDGYRYVKSKRPTISPNFNFLGQLLEYEKQLRKENILEIKPEISSAPPVCSKKRLCRTDMRTTKLSLDIDTKKNETNIFVQPRSGDQSPTTALAKLSFDVNTPEDKEAQPFFSSFKQYRSKSCYGDWLRDRDDERKVKDIQTATKVLSPVKEIKCDALISEISSSERERNLSLSKQRRQSMYSSNDENKHFNFFAQSSSSAERFSIQTLSHQSTFLSSTSDYHKSNDSKAKTKFILTQFFEKKSGLFEGAERKAERSQTCLTDTGNKRIFHVSPERSSSQVAGKESTESHFLLREPLRKTSFLHPFSFNLDSYKRSDSAGTSGFGSESSDYAESKKSEGLDIEIDELEDDVMLRNKEHKVNFSSKQGAINRSFFPLSLPTPTTARWPKHLGSPISPSESHLLEDLEMEKDHIKAGPSSPCHSSIQTDEVCDSFEDSGVPMSPPWGWHKKGFSQKTSSPTKDKRKLESFKEPVSSTQTKIRTLWFNECSSDGSRHKDISLNLGAFGVLKNSDKIGLYRVQSCPGIATQESSFFASTDESQRHSPQKYFRKNSYASTKPRESLYHESCPDVLHLKDRDNLEFQFHRHKEFRRNVRAIQVS